MDEPTHELRYSQVPGVDPMYAWERMVILRGGHRLNLAAQDIRPGDLACIRGSQDTLEADWRAGECVQLIPVAQVERL